MHKKILECLHDVRMLKVYGVAHATTPYLRLLSLEQKLTDLELMTLEAENESEHNTSSTQSE